MTCNHSQVAHNATTDFTNIIYAGQRIPVPCMVLIIAEIASGTDSQHAAQGVCVLQVGLELAGGSSLLPYTNATKQILVAAFKKSVNNDGQVQLLSVEVLAIHLIHVT